MNLQMMHFEKNAILGMFNHRLVDHFSGKSNSFYLSCQILYEKSD